MKKIFIALTFIFGILCFNMSFAQAFFGIGIEIIKDPYNKKVFVFKVLQNSTAQKYGLLEGSEIISVNGKKVKNLDIGKITNLVRGKKDTMVHLTVKYNKKQSDIHIPRDHIIVESKAHDKFETYWRQVAPDNVIVETIPQNMLNNMSKDFYIEIVPAINYWISRKSAFQYGYNFCMIHPQLSHDKCISELLSREIAKTKKDSKFILQKELINEQTLKNNISAVMQ